MATGISRTKWKQHALPTAARGAEAASLDYALAYEGKAEERAVLATRSAKVHLVLEHAQGEPAHFPNRLYWADSLPILATLMEDPAVRGHVALVYIDPPYSTSSVFKSRNEDDAYTDLLTGAEYLEFLRQRMILLRELLAPRGSIYVHLDENMAFPAKILMDEIFGASNFRNWITRKKTGSKNSTTKAYGDVSDYILFYTKSRTYTWNRPFEGWTAARALKEYACLDATTGRRYKRVPIHAPGTRNGGTGKPWRGVLPPPGKHWQFAPDTLEAMDQRGEIYWSRNGNPRRKIYLDASPGVPVQNIWLDFMDAQNQNAQITGYPTEKNPALLRRIIETSSSPGDLILDCFAGSGTTLAVASELGRQWIGVDTSLAAIRTITRRIATGTEKMGDYVTARTTPAPGTHPELFSVPEAKRLTESLRPHEDIPPFQVYSTDQPEGSIVSLRLLWEELRF